MNQKIKDRTNYRIRKEGERKFEMGILTGIIFTLIVQAVAITLILA